MVIGASLFAHVVEDRTTHSAGISNAAPRPQTEHPGTVGVSDDITAAKACAWEIAIGRQRPKPDKNVPSGLPLALSSLAP